jgi:hypothetical protein
VHYSHNIRLFGSPNGLCSSITEAKHIKAIKEPWRRSSRFNALPQMLRTISRLDQLAAIRTKFESRGMMDGTTLSYTARMLDGDRPVPRRTLTAGQDDMEEFWDENEPGMHVPAQNTIPAEMADCGPESGPRVIASVKLATRKGS